MAFLNSDESRPNDKRRWYVIFALDTFGRALRQRNDRHRHGNGYMFPFVNSCSRRRWLSSRSTKDKQDFHQVPTEASDLEAIGFVMAAKSKLASYLRQILPESRRVPEGRGFWAAPDDYFSNRDDITKVFSEIYNRNMWGEGSGGGSRYEDCISYVTLIQDILRSKAISTVVDLGCGDWQFSRFINWAQVHYIGIDVVESVVATNTSSYGKEKIEFRCFDPIGNPDLMPKGDLVLVKDVFQHLSNQNVCKLLELIEGFRCGLITNDIPGKNIDCRNGDTRPIDVTMAPFNLKAGQVVLESCGKRTVLFERK